MNKASDDRPPGAVLVVAEARSEWHGQATNRIVTELSEALGPWQRVQVVRFDAEPSLENAQSAGGTNWDLVVVRPRTPLKDVMETGLLALITTSRPRSMVIIAHDQLYPSIVSADRLWSLARQWEVQVHTIYVESNHKEIGLRRLGRQIRNVFSPDSRPPGDSARDTHRFLHAMADFTGGEVCVANDDAAGSAAANTIASKILRISDPEPQPDSPSQCIRSLAQLSENKNSPARWEIVSPARTASCVCCSTCRFNNGQKLRGPSIAY